jgi:hypothetical protein
MKFTIVVLILTALIAQSYTMYLSLIDYLFNLEAHNKKCINKAKPKLKYNGKCQMLKKAKLQTGENESSADMLKFGEPDFACSYKKYFPSLRLIFMINFSNFNVHALLSLSNHFSKIFHHPSAWKLKK